MPNTRKSTNGADGYTRPSRPKKRKFSNNQFTAEQDTSHVKASAEKLNNANYDVVDVGHTNVILCFLTVFNFLSEHLKCKHCDGNIKFTRSSERGLGFLLALTCSCGTKKIKSSPLIATAYEINRRLMFVMRIIGVGLRGINIFCSLMELSNGFGNSMYYPFLENLHCATNTIFRFVRHKAVEEEMQKNSEAGNEPTHLSVSGDGTWKKRISSLFGVTTLTGKLSGKIVDHVVSSSFCQDCANHSAEKGTPEYEEWMESHIEDCSNHERNSGKMEVNAMVKMFSRSEELLGVKYSIYIGDGDTKSFKSLIDLDPYPDIKVQMKECVAHAQKRMNNRLREIKRKQNGNELTDKLIKDLTSYYGFAIREHSDSIEEMKKAIWATFLHKSSTDKNPQHNNCPQGESSWCKWRVAEATKQLKKFKHKPPLATKVQEVIRPVYEAFSDDDLLLRCTGNNNTQNNNENLNTCIWHFAPKHRHFGSKTVEIATNLACSIFNEGYSSILYIMATLGLVIGIRSKNFVELTDRRRIEAAEMNLSVYARMIRVEKQLKAIKENQFYEEQDGLLYGLGIGD